LAFLFVAVLALGSDSGSSVVVLHVTELHGPGKSAATPTTSQIWQWQCRSSTQRPVERRASAKSIDDSGNEPALNRNILLKASPVEFVSIGANNKTVARLSRWTCKVGLAGIWSMSSSANLVVSKRGGQDLDRLSRASHFKKWKVVGLCLEQNSKR
jgi:hypothetical protein